MTDLLGALRFHAARLSPDPHAFAIRHRPGAPTSVRGRVPRGKVAALHDFFARDLCPPGPILVWGSCPPGRPPTFRVVGPLRPQERQRLRNALTLLLS